MLKLLMVFVFLTALAPLELAAAPRGNVSEAIPGTPQSASDMFLTAGAGLAIFNGNTGWALNLGALKEIGEEANLFLGADLGLNFWNYSGSTLGLGSVASSGATGIQLLPTAIYRVRFNKDSTFFPYIGLSLGPNVYIEKQTVAVGAQSDSNTRLLFEMLVRPGFYTSLSKVVGLQVEAKLGMLGSDFIFLPQASAAFAL